MRPTQRADMLCRSSGAKKRWTYSAADQLKDKRRRVGVEAFAHVAQDVYSSRNTKATRSYRGRSSSDLSTQQQHGFLCFQHSGFSRKKDIDSDRNLLLKRSRASILMRSDFFSSPPQYLAERWTSERGIYGHEPAQNKKVTAKHMTSWMVAHTIRSDIESIK